MRRLGRKGIRCEFGFFVGIGYIYQSICLLAVLRWAVLRWVSKEGRESELSCIGSYSSRRGVEGNLRVPGS